MIIKYDRKQNKKRPFGTFRNKYNWGKVISRMKKNLEFLDKLSTNEQSFIEQFLCNAPKTLLTAAIIQNYPKNHKLIRSNDTCTYVYILLKGKLQAIEERLSYEPYHFMEIAAINIVGDYELFTQDISRMVTLITMEPSRFLLLPAKDYIEWIRNDSAALFLRTQMLIRHTVQQSQNERKIHFLSNRDKLLHFLYFQYNHYAISDTPFQIKYTHTELANMTGCSVRTINRLIESFEKEELISIKRGKINLSENQAVKISGLIRNL